jgi:NAD(P)-dependent dehydrogenase (short-subunit alcohol dehydrogenase family)
MQGDGVAMRLKNAVAIVTGGGTGMGRAIAARFANEGANVTIAEIDSKLGRASEAAIRAAGGQATFVDTDVSCERQVQAMVEATLSRCGRIDVLVNNAAIIVAHGEGRAHELTNEVWDRTMGVNLRGYWLCSKFVIPTMLEQGGGSIIFIASPTGLQGFTGLTAYSASKGGVLGLMRAMAADYASEQIRVNAIVPGTMETSMTAEELSDPVLRAKLLAMAPAGRIGVAEDISGMALFLASADSAYCVGGIYPVDGGLTAT